MHKIHYKQHTALSSLHKQALLHLPQLTLLHLWSREETNVTWLPSEWWTIFQACNAAAELNIYTTGSTKFIGNKSTLLPLGEVAIHLPWLHLTMAHFSCAAWQDRFNWGFCCCLFLSRLKGPFRRAFLPSCNKFSDHKLPSATDNIEHH